MCRALRQLQVLEMRYNAIVELPVEIGDLQNLQRLDFSYNKLSVMPTELHLLKKLTARGPRAVG